MDSGDVVYLSGGDEPWLSDFREEATRRGVRFALLDKDEPLEDQFEGMRVVIDQGGHGTVDQIRLAAEAGVKLWQVCGTGLDHTNVDAIHTSGMRLANTPGAYSAVALAEHALMLMLALQKNLPTASDNCYHGVFYSPVAGELEGRSLGLIGFGASGRETAVRAHAFGMVVRAVDHITPTPEVFDRFGLTSMHNLDGLDEVLRTSDIVSLHLPLSASTQHLLDERRLGLMKKNAFVINVARGGLIDEAALIRHLQSGHLAGAGLDVFTEEPLASTNPLLRLKNVILTPHIAGITYGTSRRRNRVCVENALRVLQDKDILYEITRDP